MESLIKKNYVQEDDEKMQEEDKNSDNDSFEVIDSMSEG